MKKFMDFDLSKFPEITVTDGVNTIKGIVFGDNECFEGNRYYSFILCSNKLYKAYYDEEVVGEVEELDMIDYENAYEILDVTEEYEEEIADYLR